MTLVSANPLVTVLIAAHNSEDTIADTLTSAIASTYENLEIIVVDDGSTDRTGAITESFAEKDARVQLLRRSWAGVSVALNAGLSAALGEYIATLDSDDLWHPTKIEKQIDLAKKDPDAGFIYTFARAVDLEGRVLHDVPPQRFPRQALCRAVYECLAGAHSTAMMQRRVLDSIDGYDETLASRQDLLMQLRVIAQHPIAFVPEYLAGYRVRPNSLSSDPAAMLISWEIVRRKIDQLVPRVPTFVRRWADARQYAGLAEAFAWRGQSRQTASLLSKAMVRDPLWVSLFLSYRAIRHLRRRLRRSEQTYVRPLFYDCDPGEPFGPKPRETPLDALERHRVEIIRRQDERLHDAAAVSRTAR